jgi:alpha-N-arabinofuranosidase
MASYAPMLAKKGFTQWNTDMIFFDNVRICPTVNFYVQKMFMTNQGDSYFDNVISKDVKDSTLAASCVYDSKTSDIIIKMVNTGNESKPMKINLSNFKNIVPDAEKTVLTGNADAENTFENPNGIVPLLSTFKVSSKFEYLAPAMSLTVVRIKNKSN